MHPSTPCRSPTIDHQLTTTTHHQLSHLTITTQQLPSSLKLVAVVMRESAQWISRCRSRFCCFTSRVDGGGGCYPYPYSYGGDSYRGGGGGYQAQTSPRYGGGYGNRKLQYGYGEHGGTHSYGQQPSCYGDSYAYSGGGLPAQCPATQPTPLPTPSPTTPLPTPLPTRAPTPSPTSSREPSTHPSLSPSAQPSTHPSLSPSHEPSSNPSLSSLPTTTSDFRYVDACVSMLGVCKWARYHCRSSEGRWDSHSQTHKFWVL
eukprot:scaffold15655_cov165-Skeletonema_marinoi.AAC.1